MRATLIGLLCVTAMPLRTTVSGQAGAQVVATARVSRRAEFRVSSTLLQFEIAGEGQPVTAFVDFSVGTRLPRDEEIVLIVRALDPFVPPPGRYTGGALVTLQKGDAELPLSTGLEAPVVAASWVGSGYHTGRLLFRLHARTPGRYTWPIRFETVTRRVETP